jgi:hypothetical protein
MRTYTVAKLIWVAGERRNGGCYGEEKERGRGEGRKRSDEVRKKDLNCVCHYYKVAK